jgi:hypothetical protein
MPGLTLKLNSSPTLVDYSLTTFCQRAFQRRPVDWDAGHAPSLPYSVGCDLSIPGEFQLPLARLVE